MKFNVVTLFPEFFVSPLAVGVTGQALKKGLIDVDTVDPRQFTSDVHKTVDDRPFGGGDGMILLIEPLRHAVESLPEKGHVVFLSAHGRPWTDTVAREWVAAHQVVTLICGRYGGVDQRFINEFVDDEISLGDFVLSGGEPAAVAVIDSLTRLIPGVLGNSRSAEDESFAQGLLEHPQFTRPREFQGQAVPEILLGGHHAHIEAWRDTVSVIVTALRRPDLIRSRGWEARVRAAAERALGFSEAELRVCGIPKERLKDLLS